MPVHVPRVSLVLPWAPVLSAPAAGTALRGTSGRRGHLLCEVPATQEGDSAVLRSPAGRFLPEVTPQPRVCVHRSVPCGGPPDSQGLAVTRGQATPGEPKT